MKPSVQFQRQFISPDISSFLTELHDLLEKRKVVISFEAETLYNQGSLLTVKNNLGDVAEIEVQSPAAFDLDASALKYVFKQVMVIP